MPREYEDVFHDLIHVLAAGELSTGQRLPGERKLARRVGSRRGAVREVLRPLELRGLIEIDRDHGNHVVLARDRWDVNEADVLIALAEHDRVPDLLREAVDARANTEREAARLATGKATAGDLRLLRDHLFDMQAAAERAPRDGDRFIQGEAWFHHTLALLSGNRVLAKMSEPLHHALATIRHRRAPAQAEAALTHHRQIAEGVSSGKPQLAVSAVDAYAQQLARWLAG
jgi:GntR family transcriptional repressor for pyruvate dehydrogenase complex